MTNKSSRVLLLAPVLLCLSVIAAYSNIWRNSFLYDDEFLIQRNQSIRTWAGVGKAFVESSTSGAGGHDSFYRPMQTILYTMVYQAAGLSTPAFHLLNLLLHLANVVLIFYLGRRLRFSQLASFFAALLWGLHPIHTEAVTYQSATADPLYAFFILLAIFVWAPNFEWKRLPLVACLYAFALLSKETAIVLPAVGVACIYLMTPKRWCWRSYLVTLPLWAIAAGYLIARKTILNFDNTFHFYKIENIYTEHMLYRFYTFLATLPSYLRIAVCPSDLHMDRQFAVYTAFWSTWPVLGAVLLMAGLSFLWWERRLSRPILSFAMLWFLAAHTPHSGVLLPVNSLFLEHWLYLPSLGFFFCIGTMANRSVWVSRSFVVLAAVLAILTWRQNKIWATPISFYSNILKYENGVARVHNNLAMAYDEQGNESGAIEEYKKAIAISDQYPQTHHNLALALLHEGKTESAIRHFQLALEIDPDFYFSSRALAEIYQKQGNQELATKYLRQWQTSLAKIRR